jgi:hypothetical protein
MGGPANIGYWGGKLDPRENDRIRGMVAAKSLQALDAICMFPSGVTLNVFHISIHDKRKKKIKRTVSVF